MTVYYIGHPSGLIKIGYATNVHTRMAALERQYHAPLIILSTEPGMLRQERVRHAQFASDRINRHQEWFRPSADLLTHITEVESDKQIMAGWPCFDPGIRRVDRSTSWHPSLAGQVAW